MICNTLHQEEIDTVDLKKLIEKVLSEILSDKHECRVVLHFEKTPAEQA